MHYYALRRYSFANFMLSPIQQGIQAGHAGDELFVKYGRADTAQARALWHWAEHHKTVILLNGGTYRDVVEKYLFLQRNADSFSFPCPFACFNEDEPSLGGLMTAVSLVIPEYIYDSVEVQKATGAQVIYTHMLPAQSMPRVFADPAEPDYQLIQLLRSCSLAR